MFEKRNEKLYSRMEGDLSRYDLLVRQASSRIPERFVERDLFAKQLYHRSWHRLNCHPEKARVAISRLRSLSRGLTVSFARR